jgi:hypothetical protein
MMVRGDIFIPVSDAGVKKMLMQIRIRLCHPLKVFLYIFLAVWSVLATPLLMSPILYF